MTVHFVSAGPGALDLITLKGIRIIREAPVVLYAGSLVPKEIIDEAKNGAVVINTASMHLDEIIEKMKVAHKERKDVARVHSGDCSVYGAIGEQMRKLDLYDIPYDVIPGVPAYAATAAVLKRELTLPDISQTVILTRTSVRSSNMPKGEDIISLGKTGATLAIHLSINNIGRIVRDLTPLYGADCPVIVAYRISWPDEKIIKGSLSDIREKVKKSGITRTALIMVGKVFGDSSFNDSRLYAVDHHHVLRPKTL